MKRVYNLCYLTALWSFTAAMFFIFTTVWLLTVLFDRDRVVSHHLSRFWSKSLYRLCPWWNVKVTGLENIKHGQPYVVVSNHQSMQDIPLLYVLPFNFKWVSKREVYKIPFFGWVLWMHDDVAIERGGAASIKRMVLKCEEYLNRGVSVIMFPEGTRSKTGRVNNFKEGAMMLAQHSGSDILPVVIDGTFDALENGGIRIPHTFQVRILPPISANEISKTSVRELKETLNTLMSNTHQEMAPRHYKEKKEVKKVKTRKTEHKK